MIVSPHGGLSTEEINVQSWLIIPIFIIKRKKKMIMRLSKVMT